MLRMTPEQALRLRKSLGLSQKRISRLLHIGAKTWTRYETGKSKPSQPIILLAHLLEGDFATKHGRFQIYENL